MDDRLVILGKSCRKLCEYGRKSYPHVVFCCGNATNIVRYIFFFNKIHEILKILNSNTFVIDKDNNQERAKYSKRKF